MNLDVYIGCLGFSDEVSPYQLCWCLGLVGFSHEVLPFSGVDETESSKGCVGATCDRHAMKMILDFVVYHTFVCRFHIS